MAFYLTCSIDRRHLLLGMRIMPRLLAKLQYLKEGIEPSSVPCVKVKGKIEWALWGD